VERHTRAAIWNRKYASDAYRIFCPGAWSGVTPKQHVLNDYHSFLKKIYGEIDKAV